MRRLLSVFAVASLWLSASAQCPPAAALSVPYTENFDSQTAGPPPTGGVFGNCYINTSGTTTPRWEYENSGVGNSSSTGPISDVSGSGVYAYLETSGGTTGDTSGLVLPDINLGTLTNPELSFYYHMYGATMGDLKVYVDNGSGWTLETTITGQQQTAEGECWKQAFVSLSSYASSTVSIKFLGTRGSSFTGDISIDEIKVDDAIGCPIPTDLSFISATTTTADLTFSDVATATTYNVYYGAPGFDPSTVTPQSFTNDTITLTGLTAATIYEVYVEAVCGANVSGVYCSTTFATSCVPYTATYTRDFDTDNDGAPAQCWDQVNTATGSFAHVITPSTFNSTQPYSGTKFLEMNVSSFGTSDTLMAISPEFSDMTVGDKQVKFRVATTNTTNTLYVGTASAQQGGTIDIIDTITFAATNTWQLVILPLNATTGYNGNDKHVVLMRGTVATFSDVYVDDFSYEPIPACPQLTNVSLSSVGITTATFTYNSGGNSVQYEWGPIGFTQGTGTTGVMTSGTGTVTGLSSASCYDVYLRTDCTSGGNGYSIWSGPYTVCTLCTTQSLPYSENFDIGLGCFVVTDGGTSTATWIHATSSNTTTTTTGTALDGSPGWVEADSDAAGSGGVTMDEQLTSAYIDASGLAGTLYLEFDQYYNHLGSNAEVDVWDGNAWVNVLTQNTSNVGAFGNPDHQKIDITQYANDSLQVRFVYKDNGVWAWWWVIDNVLVQEEICARSTNFTAAFATADSIGLAWNPGAGTNFSIEYGPSPLTAGSGTVVGTTDSTITITGLSAQTSYDFILIDSCSGGSASLPVYLTAGTACAITSPAVLPLLEDFESYSQGPTFSSQDYLCNTSYFWSLNPASSNSQFRLQAGTGYYHNGTQALTMDRSSFVSSSEIQSSVMTVDLSNYSSAAGIELSFYWMRHTTTSRPGNKVYARGSVSDTWVELASLNNTVSGQWDSIIGMDIVAPLALAGQSVGPNTQIRFDEEGQSIGFSTTCCDGYTLDDVLLEAVACPLPGGLNVSGVFDTTATLNWAGSSSATNFQYWFGPSGFYQGTNSTGGAQGFSATSGVVVDTLSPFTCYEFLVRTVCQPGDTSAWSAPFQFCTPCSPISAPYMEDWDGLTAQAKDLGCFSAIEDASLSTSTFVGVTIQNSTFYNPNSSPNYVEMDNSNVNTAPLMLVSPPTTDMTAGDKRLVFYARSTFTATPPHGIVVGTMSDGTDASTFNAIDTINPDGTAFTRYVVNLTTANGYNGTDQFFAFAHGQESTFRTVLIDDVIYEQIPTCPEVSNLAVVSTDSMSAVVTFDPYSGSTGTFQIEYGTGSFGAASHSRTIVSNDTATLSNLMSGTNYCFWVREICAPGDTSIWIGPECFKTECQTIFAPYFTNFDGLTAPGKDLGCFSSYEDDGFANSNFSGVSVQNSTFNQPNSLPNVIELDNSNVTNNDLFLISPRTRDLDAGDKRIRFFARTTTTFAPPSVVVGSMSNPLDTSTFTPIDTFALSNGAMVEYTSEFTAANGYNGTDEFFVIAHDVAATFKTFYIDDLNYETIPTCIRPDSLDATNITDSSATLSWSNPSTGGSFEIEYGINPFGDPNNSRVVQGGSTMNLQGLMAGTGYCYWVRKICTPGDTSYWRGPFCFSTLCALSNPAPYFTNFNGITIGISQGTPAGWENCWTHNTVSGSVRWESEDASGANENSTGTGPLYDATSPSAPGGVYMYLETSTSGGPAELISPAIDISTISGTAEIEYWYHMHGATINKLVVYAEDATGTRTAIDSLVGQQQTNQSDPFFQRNVPLTGLTPGVYNFVFEGHRGTSFTGDISIDDFRVQAAASCPRPTFLTQSGKNLTTIDVSWTANGTGSSWEIEYGPVGFTPGSGTAVVVTTNPYTITGLTSATNYDVYVREICTAGDTSNAAGPTTMSTDICMASTKCTYYFDLKDTFGDGWNGGEITIYQNGIEVGKMGSNFTTGSLFLDSIDLCDMFTTDVVLTNQGSWASEIGLDVKDPSGAIIATYLASSATSTGDTLASFMTSCAGAPSPCLDPDSLMVTSNVGCDSIEVDWNSYSGGSLIEFGPAGFALGSGTSTGVVTAPYVLTGLNPNTAYDIYIADTCSSDTSGYVMVAGTTANAPMPVAAFTIDSAIVNGVYEVYVDASSSTNATGYQWNFDNGATSSNMIDTSVYTGNGSYTITLVVTNACGSDTATFTTNVNIGLEDNPISRSLSVYPNPANYSVNVSFNAVGSGDAVIRLLDAQGREVIRSTERANGNMFEHRLDVSQLATGIYMIEVQSGDLIARRRLSVK